MTEVSQSEHDWLNGIELGIGTMTWGARWLWGYGSSFTDSDLRAAFLTSLSAGISFFDTAELYAFGHSERLLGEFLPAAERPVVIATKFFPFPWRLRRESLLINLRASLRRLGLAQVALYYMHFPGSLVSIETWMEAMADAVEAGLIRSVGVSNYDVQQMRRAYATLAARGIPLAANQAEYSLLQRKPERTALLEACHELGVKLIAYTPLGMGLLTGKFTPDNPPSGVRRYSVGRSRLTQIRPLIALMQEIGQAYGNKTPAQIALNWLICKDAVPIPGAKNPRQAEENAGACGWRMTDEEVAALDKASDAIEG